MSTEWARARAVENEARMRKLLEERLKAASCDAQPVRLENVSITFGRSATHQKPAVAVDSNRRCRFTPRSDVLRFPTRSRQGPR